MMDARRPLVSLNEEQTEILINFQVRICPAGTSALIFQPQPILLLIICQITLLCSDYRTCLAWKISIIVVEYLNKMAGMSRFVINQKEISLSELS